MRLHSSRKEADDAADIRQWALVKSAGRLKDHRDHLLNGPVLRK